jgi:serine protease
MWAMKRWALICLVGLAAAGLAFAEAGSAATGDTTPAATTGRALIDVRTPPLPSPAGSGASYRNALADSRQLLDRVAGREGIDVVARSVPGGFLTVELNGRSIDQLRAELADDPLVSDVGLEHRAQLRYAPNDPYVYTHDLHAPGQDEAGWNVLRTGAETAWNVSRGSGAEVAVIDSGVDVTHPELAGRISGTNNTCTALLGGCQGTGVTDTDGHGTHVAGLACGSGDNRTAIASIGFGCSIYAIKSDLTWTSIINSIYDAASHGSDAISMSFGGGASPTEIALLRNALNFAFTNGSIPVAAGANTPTPSPSNNYPAQILQPEGTGPDLANGIGLVVTSASHSGNRSAFAQKTSGVSVAAYGSATDQISGGQQGILSSFPPALVDADVGAGEWPGPCQCRTSVLGDNRYAYLVGTSMATPQVSGLIALMRAAKSNISAAKSIKLIKETASGCGTYSNSSGLGWGIIRSDRAVAAAAQKDIKPPGSRVRSAKAAHVPGRGRVAILRLKRFDKGKTAECANDVHIPVTGVKAVSVFASTNRGPYHRIAKTRKEKILFGAKPGRRYRFFSVAVDKAGNREPAPATADAKIRLGRKR